MNGAHFNLWEIESFFKHSPVTLKNNKDHFLCCPLCCRKLLHAYNSFIGSSDLWQTGSIAGSINSIKNSYIKELVCEAVEQGQTGIIGRPDIPSFLLEEFNYFTPSRDVFMSRDIIINGNITLIKPEWLLETVIQNGIPNIEEIHFYTEQAVSSKSNKVKCMIQKFMFFDFMLSKEHKQYCYLQDTITNDFVLLRSEEPKNNIVHKRLEELLSEHSLDLLI